MATLLLFSLILLSIISFSSPLSSQTLLSAAAVLSVSGFDSMALTLQLVSDTLIPSSNQNVTIFSPPDAAFAQSGQPSLSLLQFHFSPRSLSQHRLQSLPYGAKIPTMSGHSLRVTTSESDRQISLNNVTVNGSPVYDDGSLIIFGIEKFFDPKFRIPAPIRKASTILQCRKDPNDSGSFSFGEASGLLRSTGYSVMASFLDLQLKALKDQANLTVFAPIDEGMIDNASNFSEYSSLFFRHVLPCKFMWSELGNFDDGTTLRTSLEGFRIDVTKSGDVVLLNEIPVTFPDMYSSDWLVVHGLREILTMPERPEAPAESSSDQNGGSNKEKLPDREF
ncbi:putative fasciclin-like arabinogalactan protein 20 [Malania oleifera]|uniref:putative fasciclin-like arabinogalactan protein 20 n=1 Tax=Malania oleifera TaxID=397392 RepID=UPI0025ADFD51|nr:putative fasciclin-like arabinogalactan protein 20 [Malania oleifera]